MIEAQDLCLDQILRKHTKLLIGANLEKNHKKHSERKIQQKLKDFKAKKCLTLERTWA